MDASQFTDAALRRAYAAIRRRHWPDFEGAMQDELYRRLIACAAWRAARPASSQAIPAPRPQPHPRAAALPTPQPILWDRKRAAAGDNDDD